MAHFSETEKEFVRSYNKKLILLSTVAVAVFLGVLIPTYTGQLDLGRNSEPLETPLDRVLYSLKHLSIQLAWIILSMYYVIYHRLGTPALDPTKGYEELCQNAKNILTNSVEHGLVFMVSQLIMAIDLSPSLCRRLVPTYNLVYLFGRLFFMLGYPCNRGFGFIIVNFSIIVSVSFNLYQLADIYV